MIDILTPRIIDTSELSSKIGKKIFHNHTLTQYTDSCRRRQEEKKIFCIEVWDKIRLLLS